MSRSSESLSPDIPSLDLPDFVEAKASFNAALANYEPLDHSDDTKRFLEICFKYLPLDGQLNLSEDVCECRNDEQLHQLADSIDTGLLRPLLSKGGKTPAITPSPRVNFDDDLEYFHSLDLTSASRNDQERLLQNCLKRDGYRCVITNTWSTSRHPPNQSWGPLDAVHILPFSLGSFGNEDERRQSSMVWVNVFRYFPSVISLLTPPNTTDPTFENVNKVNNMMMMLQPLHQQFGSFHLVLESTMTPNRYRVKTFPSFPPVYLYHLLPERVITLTSHDRRYPLPAAKYLELHAAIGNILHASGRGELIEKLMRDLGDNGGTITVLRKDGNMDLGALLSVSGLSLLASNPSAETSFSRDKEQRRVRDRLPGTENEQPK